jgi:hypothetical protein
MMNPATNAAAIAIMITQTQMEALASFFSSISVTSFVAIEMSIVTPFPLTSSPWPHIIPYRPSFSFFSAAKLNIKDKSGNGQGYHQKNRAGLDPSMTF